MPDVAKLEAEAEAKGLHGQAEKRYVGGVFNKIRQAHARGTTPGKGARHLKRAARQEARAAAKNRVARHEQLAAQEKLRLRGRTHREEPRGQATAVVKPAAPKLVPLPNAEQVTHDYVNAFDTDRSSQYLMKLYGSHQIEQALDDYSGGELRAMAKRQGVASGGSREALIKRLAVDARTHPEANLLRRE